jgi:Bifunctional DNA primase/polymerase, N-terminal
VGAVADNPQLAQALKYAAHGWPVFPAVPGEKIPVTPRGFKDATTGEAQIRAWWQANPDRNIGIATGWPGPDVVDVDNHGKAGNGFAAWNQAKRAGLLPQPQAIVQTPSGGMHAYYAGTEQRSASIGGKHLDFRAAGGYVVAPHSTVGGKPYLVVQRQASAATVDFAAVRQLVDPQPERPTWNPAQRVRDGGQNLDHLVTQMAGQPEGNRNGFLHWAANRVLDHGQDERLTELANAAVAAGLPRREADRTITSARQQPRQDPHATPQQRGQTRLTPRREPEPAKGAPTATAAGRQEEPPAHAAVLNVDRDGPQRAESSPEPTQAPEHGPEPQQADQGRTEHHHAEPVAREPGGERGHQAEPEHDAASEPRRGQAASPFAQARPAPEPEAGE